MADFIYILNSYISYIGGKIVYISACVALLRKKKDVDWPLHNIRNRIPNHGIHLFRKEQVHVVHRPFPNGFRIRVHNSCFVNLRNNYMYTSFNYVYQNVDNSY